MTGSAVRWRRKLLVVSQFEILLPFSQHHSHGRDSRDQNCSSHPCGPQWMWQRENKIAVMRNHFFQVFMLPVTRHRARQKYFRKSIPAYK